MQAKFDFVLIKSWYLHRNIVFMCIFLRNCGGYNRQNLDNRRCCGLNLILVQNF